MTLPGKLCVGLLQEDNPQKYYFRVRPLLVAGEGAFHPVDGVETAYLQDGFIRVVPDKNEISHFKTRMRNLGRYCVLDLRRHPNENDKIRPNKNFDPENGDRNANIVYSDVVFRLPPSMAAEVLDAPEDEALALACERPGTQYLMLRRGAELMGPYIWQQDTGRPGWIELAPAPENPMLELEEAQWRPRLFQVERGQQQPAQLLVGLSELGIKDPPPARLVRPEPREKQPAPARPAEAPARPGPEPEQPQQAAEVPAPAVQPAAPSLPPAEEAPAAKPWLQAARPAADAALRQAPGMRGSRYADASLRAQCGINPRRGRSLHDVVDEQWRQSRFDQLGHPVPDKATGQPVTSPVERAMEALREAWALPGARATLVGEMMKDEGLKAALTPAPEERDARALEAAQRPLNELEADRLKLVSEIDELRMKRAERRAELMNELRQTHQEEIRRSEQRVERARREAETNERQAEQARQAANSAKDALRQLLENDLDSTLRERVAGSRAYDMMRSMLGAGSYLPTRKPEVSEPSAGELVADLRVAFERAGWTLSNDEAVNLLACLALSRITLISGPTGSGKSGLIRLLAAALGLSGEERDRFLERQVQPQWEGLSQLYRFTENGLPVARWPEVERLLEIDDGLTPTLVMLDNANVQPIERYAEELLRLDGERESLSLQCGVKQIKFSAGLRVMMSVLDEGAPLSARVLDRAFLVRLPELSATAPWNPGETAWPRPERAVSLEALQRIFAPGREVPLEVEQRLGALRAQLAGYGVALSRRTLTALWSYCSAVIPMMQMSPVEVLDYAFAQRALPTILASAGLEALHALPELLRDMPRSRALLYQPLPLPEI